MGFSAVELLVLLVLLGVAVLVVGAVVGAVALTRAATRRRQQRTAGMAAYAAARGWTFLPGDPRLVDRFAGPPFGRGHARTATDVLHGTSGGRAFTAFDLTFRTSNGDEADTTHRWSVVAVSLGVVAPGLSVARQGGIGRLLGQLTGSDLRLGDPAFDDAFRVTCEDPRFAADVLHPAMRRMLVAGDDLAWRIDRDSLLLLRQGTHSPAEVDARLAAAAAILAQVPEPVWRALRGGTPG